MPVLVALFLWVLVAASELVAAARQGGPASTASAIMALGGFWGRNHGEPGQSRDSGENVGYDTAANSAMSVGHTPANSWV